jgi:hypothetical protein
MSDTQQNFEGYKDSCFEEMSSLQDAFMALYDINSYENWFYDHGIGVFNFKSDDGRNLYFKYVDVGSFSTATNTWNWSWNNESTPYNVKRGIEKVRSFGEAQHFDQLTQGLTNGDEYTGWDCTVVAAKLLSALGMYRFPHEHLFCYFIFTNELNDDEYNILKDKLIECDRHESGTIAFVCKHLISNDNIGFHEAFESSPLIEPDDDYQAWCDECEVERLKEGEWNDSDIKLVCDQCYFEIKERNRSDK